MKLCRKDEWFNVVVWLVCAALVALMIWYDPEPEYGPDDERPRVVNPWY
jgi:hypothetical protein